MAAFKFILVLNLFIIMQFTITSSILTSSLDQADEKSESDEAEDEKDEDNHREGCESYRNIKCNCGPDRNGQKVAVRIKMCSMKNPLTGEAFCEPCDSNDRSEHLCKLFQNCETCDRSKRQCSTCMTSTDGNFCEEPAPLVPEEPPQNNPNAANSVEQEPRLKSADNSDILGAIYSSDVLDDGFYDKIVEGLPDDLPSFPIDEYDGAFPSETNLKPSDDTESDSEYNLALNQKSLKNEINSKVSIASPSNQHFKTSVSFRNPLASVISPEKTSISQKQLNTPHLKIMPTSIPRSKRNISIDKIDLNLVYPIRIHYPIGLPIEQQHELRKRAPTTKCPEVPTHLKTVEFECIYTRRKITCSQKCTWGFTFEEGTTRVNQCRHKNHRWQYPHDQECKSFVACELILKKSGGNFQCMANMLDFPTNCNVTCNATGITKQHFCSIDSNWTPPLPECVEKKGGVSIIPIPCFEDEFDDENLMNNNMMMKKPMERRTTLKSSKIENY